MVLTKEQMLRVEKRRYKTIDVPELGGEIKIASLSAGASLRLNSLRKASDGAEFSVDDARILLESVVEPKLDTAEEMDQFIDTVSNETLSAVLREIMALSAPGFATKNGAGVAEQNPSSAALNVSSPSA